MYRATAGLMLDKLSMFVESVFKLLNFFGPPKQEKYYSLCAVANNATFVLRPTNVR